MGGLRIINVIGAVPDPTSLLPMLQSDDVDGMLWYTFPDGYSGTRGTIHFLNGKPVIGGRVSLWGDNKDTSTNPDGTLKHGDMLGVVPLVVFVPTCDT